MGNLPASLPPSLPPSPPPLPAARRRRSLSGSLWLAGSSRLTSRRTRSGRQRGQRAPPPHFAPATAHLACDPSHRRLRTSPCPLGPHRGALPVAIQGRGGRVHGDRGAGRALGAKRTQPPRKVGTRELRVGRRDPQLFKADTGTHAPIANQIHPPPAPANAPPRHPKTEGLGERA